MFHCSIRYLRNVFKIHYVPEGSYKDVPDKNGKKIFYLRRVCPKKFLCGHTGIVFLPLVQFLNSFITITSQATDGRFYDNLVLLGMGGQHMKGWTIAS